MISSILPSKVLMLVVAVCLGWIGLLSLAITALSGFTIANGWLLAGALIFATVAWVMVMVREMSNAVDMPEDLATDGQISDESDELDDAVEEIPMFATSIDRNSGTKWASQLTQARRGRPRKVRSTAAIPPVGPANLEFFHPDI